VLCLSKQLYCLIFQDPYYTESCIGFITTVAKCFKRSTDSPENRININAILEASIATLVSFLRQLHKKKCTKTIENNVNTGTGVNKVGTIHQLELESAENLYSVINTEVTARQDVEVMDWLPSNHERNNKTQAINCTQTISLPCSVGVPPLDGEVLGSDWTRVERLAEDAIGLMLSHCSVEQFTKILHDGIKDMVS
jgi:hypothetical protein